LEKSGILDLKKLISLIFRLQEMVELQFTAVLAEGEKQKTKWIAAFKRNLPDNYEEVDFYFKFIYLVIFTLKFTFPITLSPRISGNFLL
jgi:hypothetical protein